VWVDFVLIKQLEYGIWVLEGRICEKRLKRLENYASEMMNEIDLVNFYKKYELGVGFWRI
jgi:hypothetical protein